MRLTGVGEFRGFKERYTKENKQYFLLKFEDESSDQFECYCPADANFAVPRESLVKGRIYSLEFDYRFNSFSNSWQLDLADILDHYGGGDDGD